MFTSWEVSQPLISPLKAAAFENISVASTRFDVSHFERF